MHIVKRHHSRV